MSGFSEGNDAPLLQPDGSATSAALTIRVPDELDRLHEHFVAFVRGYRNHSPASIKWYRQVYGAFRKHLAAQGVVVLDLTSNRFIEQWIASARSRGVSPFTARSYWQGLRPFFVYLDEHEGFQSPYRAMKPPACPDALPKARTEAECIRILEAAQAADWSNPYEQARAAAMLAMALYAGLRKSEILRLKFTDVDLKDGSIHIVRGKGRGGGKDRTTYIAPELRTILETYLDQRRYRRLLSVEFFTSQRSGRGISGMTLRRVMERVRQTSGIPFSLHSLRHSFVTTLLRRGVPIHVVRELAGHSQIATTARYTRVFEEDKLRAVEAVSFMARPAVDPRPDAASGSPPHTPARRHGYTA
jgi:integrase/recombinase XerD